MELLEDVVGAGFCGDVSSRVLERLEFEEKQERAAVIWGGGGHR